MTSSDCPTLSFCVATLPTNTALSPASFDQSTVTLLPPAGVISGSELTSLTLRVLTPGDTSRDGSVDLTDFGILKDNFGKSGAAAVPEPSTWLLMALGALALLGLRRRS